MVYTQHCIGEIRLIHSTTVTEMVTVLFDLRIERPKSPAASVLQDF